MKARSFFEQNGGTYTQVGDVLIPTLAVEKTKPNLKKLGFDQKNKKYILHSCNPDTEMYPDIIVDELQMQGIVKGSYPSG